MTITTLIYKNVKLLVQASLILACYLNFVTQVVYKEYVSM